MFYVYNLVDPRDNQVFYVGKGKGTRAFQHERDIRKGLLMNNKAKSAVISEIIASGASVKIEIVAQYNCEQDALSHEKRLIESLDGLTNIVIPFDAAEYLDAEGQAELVADALASGDATYIRHALNVAARARGMTHVARDAGVTREALYKALGSDGDPKLSTVLGVLKALGVTLSGTMTGATA